MKKTLIISAVVLVLATILFFYTKNNKTEIIPEISVKTGLENLTIEQKIGQLFIAGIDGKEVTKETETFIKTFHPGGILLLGKNISDKAQVKKLIKDLQEIALSDTGIPLLIAIDQEGGIISRIKWLDNTPEDKIKSDTQAYNLGLSRGQGLKELGVNLNLAPLLDEAGKQDFVFNRSFQKDEQTAGSFAGQLIKGQQDGGILTALKHFPGYGGISFNPEDKRSVLENVPGITQFKIAAESGPEVIMVTDVIYNEIDPLNPFVFSVKGIEFLKNEIPGDYLVVSDDLNQYVFLNNYPLQDIVTKPVKAGVDLLIFSGYRLSSDVGFGAFKEAVSAGKINEEDINNKVLRILRLKEKIK